MSQLLRVQDQVCVVNQLKRADTFVSRLRGLIGVKNFSAGEGLLFPRCNSIHMWMMSISIDAVFLKVNQENTWTVTSIYHGLRPWKILPVGDLKADDVLELPVGSAKSIQLKVGEVLCIAS